jgi:hypothetical protein
LYQEQAGFLLRKKSPYYDFLSYFAF